MVSLHMRGLPFFAASTLITAMKNNSEKLKKWQVYRKPKLHPSNYSELSCFYDLCASWFYVNLTQVLVTWGGNLNWENAPTWLGCGQACGTVPPLMTTVKWPSSLWVVVLGAMRKQAEQTMDRRTISRVPPWLPHQLLLQVSRLLSWVPDLTSLDSGPQVISWNKLFPS